MRPTIGVLLCLSLVFITAAEEDTNVVLKPPRISSGIEAGQLISGTDEDYHKSWVDHQWNSRLSVWLTQEVVIKKRLTLKMGVGGLFWYSFPEYPNDAGSYTTKFGPGISQANGLVKFGDLDNPFLELQFGYFPFKYNNEALNLGEYLLRSGCYPGYLKGGSWNIIGDALYRILGIRLGNTLNLFDGSATFNHNIIMNMEREIYPLYDLSLTFLGDYSFLNNIIDIGAGIDFNHLISANSQKTTPEQLENRYYDGVPFPSDTTDTIPCDYYTFRGIKVMGKLTFDPKPIFNNPEIFGKEDLKLYGELALLGLKDYPFYYDDLSKRMPVMFGFNIPCFKILDVLSIQLEWYGSEFDNSTLGPFWYQRPLPPTYPNDPLNYLEDTTFFDYGPPSGDAYYNKFANYGEFFSTDNWKWSIFMKKSFGKYFSLYLQMANDHLRLKHYSARDHYIPATRGNDKPFMFFQEDWYYMLRINYGI